MTLIEIAMVSVISMIVAAVSMRTLVYIQRSTVRISMINQMAQESRFLADQISTDARNAIELEASYGSYTAGADTMILKLPSIDSSGDIINIDTTFDRIVYYPGGGSTLLVREIIPHGSSARIASTKTIGSLVTGEAFTGTFASQPNALGAYVIHYQFKLSQTLLGRATTIPISGSVRLRNKA